MKYKIGDRVRIVSSKETSVGWNSDGLMDKWLGKVMTIRNIQGDAYKMIEDKGEFCRGGWFWFENMIEGLADNSKKKVEDWTEYEVQQARVLTTNLLTEIIYNGGDIRFYKGKTNKTIDVLIYKTTFSTKRRNASEAYSICSNDDKYNEWIGKCVAVCKALNHPIPDFIMNKNK